MAVIRLTNASFSLIIPIPTVQNSTFIHAITAQVFLHFTARCLLHPEEDQPVSTR